MVKIRVIYEILAERAISTEQPRSEVIHQLAETDFLALFTERIETKGKDYTIAKRIEIKKDTVFPVGNYHIMPDCGIIAKDCKITIQPGTNFYFEDYAFFSQNGGKFIAAGNDGNKIQFLSEGENINMHVSLSNLESQLEYCVLSHFNSSALEKKYPWAPCSLFKCKSSLKNCKFSHNTGQMTAGGVYVNEGEAIFDSCIISRNMVGIWGGGVYAKKTKIKFKETEIENNHGTNGREIFGGGVMGDESILEFDDCKIIGNTANCGAGVQLSDKCKAEFRKTTIRNNIVNGIALLGNNSEVYLDDECILEGNGEPQLNGGMHKGEFKYNQSILRKNEAPGADNLPAVLHEISKQYEWTIKEEDIPRILSKTQKKYNLGESEMYTLTYGLREMIEKERKMDQILKDPTPPPYRSGRRLP